MRSRVLVLLLAGVIGCSHPAALQQADGDSDFEVGYDLWVGVEDAGGGGLGGSCDDRHVCAAGGRCFLDRCVPDNGTCDTDDTCENDTYCACQSEPGDAGSCPARVCVPWGAAPPKSNDSTCSGPSFVEFTAPRPKCVWTDPNGDEVSGTPIVIDLTGDSIPEIVFSNVGTVVAIRSKDCSTLWTASIGRGAWGLQLAAGDLDGDGKPEVVALDGNGGVLVFDHQGMLLASGSGYTQPMGSDCTGPTIANVDGIAGAEIIVAGQVLEYQRGVPRLTNRWNHIVNTPIWGTQTAVADLDGDGIPEVISGAQIFDGKTGVDKTPASLTALGLTGSFAAVADFNRDRKPDLVLVQSAEGLQKVLVYDYARMKVIFGPYTVAEGGWGGPPNVADFDGDGVPDFGVAGRAQYYVYALKCAANKPLDCTGTDPGVLWEKTIQDHSGSTGSTVFDFNGDGRPEVIYRDECWLRAYEGATGKVLFAVPLSAGTGEEEPVIADVDGDGHAELIVSSTTVAQCPDAREADTGAKWTGLTHGVFVFQDRLNQWVSSRRVWNQNTYHITNINDDLSTPAVEKGSWIGDNSYRKNLDPSHPSGPLADFTSGAVTGIEMGDPDCSTAWTLRAQICNRGTGTVLSGVAGTFYSSDPRVVGAASICTALTTEVMPAGGCVAASCVYANPPVQSLDLWFRANDEGTGKKGLPECKTGNDLLFEPKAKCSPLG